MLITPSDLEYVNSKWFFSYPNFVSFANVNGRTFLIPTTTDFMLGRSSDKGQQSSLHMSPTFDRGGTAASTSPRYCG